MICVKFTLSNMWCTVNQEETEMKNEFQMTILHIKKKSNTNYKNKKLNIERKRLKNKKRITSLLISFFGNYLIQIYLLHKM